MIMAASSASRPSSFFPHRYSADMPPESSSTNSFRAKTFASSSLSSSRDSGTHRMASSKSSPNANQQDGHWQSSKSRRSSHGDLRTDSSSSEVKYACASCIRGHRTSSCTHQDGSKGPLQPIRSKGRPPTQCEICRKKRKETGRHVRCDCTGKKATAPATASTSSHSATKPVMAKTNAPILPQISDSASTLDDNGRPSKRPRNQPEPSAAQASSPLADRRISDADSSDDSPSQFSAADNFLAPIRPSQTQHSWSLPSIHAAHNASTPSIGSQNLDGELAPRRSSTLSLSSLMNPCGCRITGSCTTCSEQRRRQAPISPKQVDSALSSCDPLLCSSSDQGKQIDAATQNHAEPPRIATSGCCSSRKAPASAAPSIELLLRAVDMTTEFVPPPCGCGQGCRCSRCLARKDAPSALVTSEVQRSTSNRASSTVTASSVSPRTPPASLAAQPAATGPACDDCAACDLGLERPSGIGAVDSWIEKQRDSRSSAARRSPSAEISVSPNSGVPSSLHPPASSPVSASVPMLHGGLMTSEAEHGDQVHAELVLVHPKCVACLEVVRSKGVGVLSSVPHPR